MIRPEELALQLLRRWWIIALVALVAATVAYLGTSSQPKTYTSSARVMAIADPPDYWMDLYAKNRLASYKDLINNWDFVAWSLQQAGSSIDPGTAQSKLQLGHNPDANIVHVVAVDTEPTRAAEIVNAVVDGFILRNEEQNAALLARPRATDAGQPGIVQMEKLDTPTAPSVASGPRVKVNTLAGAVLGGVVGIVLAFGLLYFNDTLRNRDELERYLELPTLAELPPTAAGYNERRD